MGGIIVSETAMEPSLRDILSRITVVPSGKVSFVIFCGGTDGDDTGG